MPVRCLEYDKINKRLISASDDLHVNIVDSETGKVILPLVGHKDFISSIDINFAKNIYATGSHDGSIKLWDMKNLKCIQTLKLLETDLIYDISISNDGKYLICGSENYFNIFNTN